MNLGFNSLFTAVAALVVVLALVWLGARAARMTGLAPRPAGTRLLALRDTIALDSRRRLLVVRCGARDVVLLTGGAQDLVAGWLPYADIARQWCRRGRSRGMKRRGCWCGSGCWRCWRRWRRSSVGEHRPRRRWWGGRHHAGVQLTALITVLSLAPSLLVMVTAFTRIVVVMSLLRSALGTQGTPPNTVLIGLALFLTFFVMQPVLDQSWTMGLLPMSEGRVSEMDGLSTGRRAVSPLHER